MLTVQEERSLEHQLKVMENELVTRIERRRQKEVMSKRLDELNILLPEIKEEERNQKQAKLFSIKFQNDKRLKDAETISNAMELASELVLQQSNIKPKFKTTNGRYPESTLVVENNGREVLLETTEGTGVAESVSNITNLSILHSTQYTKTFLSDEYYSSVSPSNSERISEQLNELVDDKIQLVMIEQKDEIFKHASYREFAVVHDGVKSVVTTYDVDKYGNKTIVETAQTGGEKDNG